MKQFFQAPDDTLFDQKMVAAVTHKSVSWCERMRWQGGGVPFKKMGQRCLYYKRDIVNWIDQHQTFYSTSEYPSK